MARSKSKKYRDNHSGDPALVSPRQTQKKKTSCEPAEGATSELELNQQIDELIKSIEASINATPAVEPNPTDPVETESNVTGSPDETSAHESNFIEAIGEPSNRPESNFSEFKTSAEPIPARQSIEFNSTTASDEPLVQDSTQQFDAISALLEQRLDGFLSQLESKVETWLVQLQEKIKHVQISNVIHPPSNGGNGNGHSHGATPGHSASIPQSDWEIRKRQMLSEIGLSSEEIEQIVPPPKAPTDHKHTETLHRSGPDHGAHCVAIHIPEPLETVQSSEEIEQLKEQLNEKLREAEVELAINRARLSKEWAAVEQQKAALTQREADWRSKHTGADGCPTTTAKKGILDRFARHMTRRNDK